MTATTNTSSAGTRRVPWVLLPCAAGAVIALLPALGTDPYWTRQIMLIAVLAMLVSGLNLTAGFAGELALGQVAIYAAGAYTAALLGVHGHTGLFTQLVGGGVAAVALGLLAGIPGLRFGGWALAMASFFLVLILPDVVALLGSYGGGFAGLAGIPTVELFGRPLTSGAVYLLVVVVAGLWLAVFRNIVNSRLGNALLVLRQSPVLAASLGIPVYRTKVLAYALGSIPAGLAGVLFTQIDYYIAPATFNFGLAIAILAASVVGGQRSVYGAVFGAVLLQIGPQQFTGFQRYSTVVYGAFLLAAGVLLGQGVAGLVRPWVRRFVPGSRPVTVPAPVRSAATAPQPPTIAGERLDVERVGKRFGGTVALDGVTLAAQPGQVTALIGPNGSGKTTLLNMICGYYRVDSGAIWMGGRALHRLRPHQVARCGVARTFQTPTMPQTLTTAEVIASGRNAMAPARLLDTVLRLPRYWRVRRADGREAYRILGLLGLAEHAEQEAASLPLGTRRLVEVGRAIASGAKVLLLDEVASGLDEEELDRLAMVIRQIRAAGATVVLVEHNFALVLRLADVIYVLAEGSLLAAGTPEQIRANAEVADTYLGLAVAEQDAEREVLT